MLRTHTTCCSLYLLFFSSSQVSSLTTSYASTIFFLLLSLFSSLFAANSLEKRCVPAVFSFRTLSNCPVDLLSLSVHACLTQCSVGMRLVGLRPGPRGICTVLIQTMTSVPQGLTVALFPASEEQNTEYSSHLTGRNYTHWSSETGPRTSNRYFIFSSSNYQQTFSFQLYSKI